MRKFLAVLLILAALSPLYYADTPYSVKYFASFILPNTSSYSLDSTIFENQTVYFILTDDKIISVMLPTQSAGKYSPATDTKKIGEIMRSYYYSLGYTPQAAEGLSSAHEKIIVIKGRRASGEQKCRVLLGTDRHSCTDFFSCQVACYSVTSFCQPVALGAGREFINYVWAFENNSRDLDAAYASEESSYAAWSSNRTSQTMADYLSSINDINKAATQASSSPLYDGYSYCFRPDYALADITSVQLSAQKDYASSSRFISLPDDINEVMRYAISGLQKKFDYEVAFNKSMGQYSASNKTVAPAPAANVSSKSPAQQASSSSAFLFLAAGSLAVVVLAAGLAFYLLRRKKRGRK
ncbi:MAG: hypothetical protein NTV88_01995 [Candidatus Micrarchaeota archaeon]|nr:hypothetical protein [Candidatus Micrarchaeota archaeon]